MNTPSPFASALPSERDLRLIRRKAAQLRAEHLRSLLGRLAAFLKGRTADLDPHRLGGGRAAG
ncbi:hypothetical protein FBZ82_102372 [Azospirillum brasilense]|uniref:Uncharacterized protein n=1 Tax=Azospirillum brasilense TaxID=192 RepID=A0A560CL89_AZOBR|nr:hypothetical protein [Azospirillum brasilense]MBK3732168.1 hypothetical protein [Azospirillum brasilense]TWA72771.1 hypothetical protein FBZ82_102372 [Azospirillum brasilense]TWA85601.1 hypothetical protein FBZ83_103193 [Azospirillum brasilense]